MDQPRKTTTTTTTTTTAPHVRKNPILGVGVWHTAIDMKPHVSYLVGISRWERRVPFAVGVCTSGEIQDPKSGFEAKTQLAYVC